MPLYSQSVNIVGAQTVTGTKTFQALAVSTTALDLQVGQITFPATQNASGAANVLDDYEIGTTTPTIIGSTVAGVGTYNSQKLRYQKVGNTVHYWIWLSWTNHTGTGNMLISGLPFTINSTTDYYGGACVHHADNMAVTAGKIPNAYGVTNTITINLQQTPTGGGAQAAIPMDTAVSGLMVFGSYAI